MPQPDLFDLLPEPTEKLEWVDADIFRDKFAKSPKNYTEVARAAGLYRTNPDRRMDPDASAVRKALKRKRVSYATAVSLCRGLGIPPHEAGV